MPAGSSAQPRSSLDLAQLESALHHYAVNCVAPATRASYATAQRRYLSFCTEVGVVEPWPVVEAILCRYVTFLGQQGLKHRSIKAYLSGLRFAQIQLGLGNPFAHEAMLQLEYVLTGIKRVQAHQAPPLLKRLPITIEIMRMLQSVWVKNEANAQTAMLWAAACTGFFGFLRAGEFTIASRNAYDPQVHFSLADLSIDSHSAPTMISLRIKQSKTDPFRQGVDVFLGATQADICPVKAMVDYIAVRPQSPGPLFITDIGTPLTRNVLVNELHACSPAATRHSPISI